MREKRLKKTNCVQDMSENKQSKRRYQSTKRKNMGKISNEIIAKTSPNMVKNINWHEADKAQAEQKQRHKQKNL